MQDIFLGREIFKSRGAQNRTGIGRTPCAHSTTEPHPEIFGYFNRLLVF